MAECHLFKPIQLRNTANKDSADMTRHPHLTLSICAAAIMLCVNTCQAQGTNFVITTVAGTGVPGYSGDGGAATSAALGYPRSVAVDQSGNIYIADVGNNRVRKVSTNGTITTVAGNGTPGFAGDGGAAT